MRLAAGIFLVLLPSPAFALSPWMIFFEPNSAAISPAGKNTLEGAFQWHRNTDIRKFLIVGHADRRGTARDNLRLAQRRAEAVKMALIGRGVPANFIMVQFEGEATPLVETADGVGQPENRRVEIIAEQMCRPPSGPPLNC